MNTLPFVSNMERALRFYRDGLGLRVLEDTGNFVRFAGGFALHEGDSLHRSVFAVEPDPTPFGRRNLVLYFESDDLPSDFRRLADLATVIHPIRTLDWGGRVFRVFDPDDHIVEVGEDA